MSRYPRATAVRATAASSEEHAKTKSPSSSRLHDHLAYWIHRLSSSILTRFDQKLSEHGVTVAQWKVLMVLYRNDANTPQTLSQYIDVDSGAITRIVDRLIAKKLIRRRENSVDRRSITIELTKSGSQVIGGLIHIADVQDDDWQRTLSAEERATLKKLMGKLLLAQGIDIPGEWRRSVSDVVTASIAPRHLTSISKARRVPRRSSR
jgi:DNA-binding MarR family transcriptional regulator